MCPPSRDPQWASLASGHAAGALRARGARSEPACDGQPVPPLARFFSTENSQAPHQNSQPRTARRPTPSHRPVGEGEGELVGGQPRPCAHRGWNCCTAGGRPFGELASGGRGTAGPLAAGPGGHPPRRRLTSVAVSCGYGPPWHTRACPSQPAAVSGGPEKSPGKSPEKSEEARRRRRGFSDPFSIAPATPRTARPPTHPPPSPRHRLAEASGSRRRARGAGIRRTSRRYLGIAPENGSSPPRTRTHTHTRTDCVLPPAPPTHTHEPADCPGKS